MVKQPDSTPHPPAGATHFEEGLKVVERRESGRTRFEVYDGTRLLTTHPTKKKADRHAAGVPFIEYREDGSFWLWQGRKVSIYTGEARAKLALSKARREDNLEASAAAAAAPSLSGSLFARMGAMLRQEAR